MAAENDHKHITICLGKALTQQPGPIAGKEGLGPVYISIGYFDTLQICPLKTEKQNEWLKEAYAKDIALSNGLTESFFFKTVHCAALDSEDNDVEQFMQKQAPYLFVTFLQGRCTTTKTWENNVLSYLKNEIGKSAGGGEDGVSYAVYRPLALCDMVILWKSDRILPILQKIQRVYYAPMVGDMHSIPAILKEEILSARLLPEETIPRVTVRYLVRNAYEAYRYFASQYPTENHPLFTVGIEDITSVFDHLTTAQLKEMLAKRLTDQEHLEQFNKAFAECEMHFGDTLREGQKNPDADTGLYDYCRELQEKFQTIREKLEEQRLIDSMDGPWLKAASEFYYALSSLSYNILADGFCYLVLGAAAVFCKKLEALAAKPDSGQLRKIQRFIRGWGTLMEQVLRNDGKFSQQPSFTPPPLCDVPANLLEFYLAFTCFASEIMQNSSDAACEFPLLLVPKLCRRIKVESVFDDPPPCSRLLYVDIPISLLYDPYIVLSHLTHEISHFAGDDWRLREIRAEKYYEIWVTELAAELGFEKERTKHKIKEEIALPTDSSRLYLEDLSGYMQYQLQTALSDETVIQRWLEAEYGEHDFVGHCKLVQSMNQITQMKQSLYDYMVEPPGQFFDIMREFHTLFRECYADIVAVYLLQLDLNEYLGLASQEIELYDRTYKRRGEQYYLSAERWAMVISVSYPEQVHSILASVDKKEKSGHTAEIDRRFAEDIQQCIYYLLGEVAPGQLRDTLERNYHRIDCIGQLMDYLFACRREMLNAAGARQNIDKLRGAFRGVFSEDSIFSEPCQEIVYMYRDAAVPGTIGKTCDAPSDEEAKQLRSSVKKLVL